VNFDKLRRLEPTHVIVNIDETPKSLADDLAALGCDVVVTHPIEVRDNVALFRLMGGVFGREGEAEGLCSRFLSTYEALEEVARSAPERPVLYLIWRDPWMTVSPDTYISRMLALVHWCTQPRDEDSPRYPTVDLNEEILAGCERVLFSSEPFPFQERHLEDFRRTFPVHAGKAAMIDAQMVSWYGSRAIAGLHYLRRLAVPGQMR
jgi:ABC-type Fe3+-hydroxamate transport system substrate-binding protein